ncbi:MAG: CHASE2 domain-containing protein [Nitrospiraceae bacterium]
MVALVNRLPPAAGYAVRGLVIGSALVLGALLGLFDSGERWGLTKLFALRGPVAPSNPILIISIAEDSFDELDLAWPWPRALHAELLDRIRQGHPAAVGFDIVFPEPSARGPEDDRVFAEAVGRGGKVVVAAALTTIHETTYTKEDLNAPITLIRERAAGVGFANFVLDDDAFVRSAAISRRFQGQEAPSLALALARVSHKDGFVAPASLAVPFLINYRGGPRTFHTVPYYRVLHGEVNPEMFAGRFVLVGSTSPILHDMYPTPVAPGGDMAGVEIQANVLDNLLAGDPLTRASRVLAVGSALIAGLLAVWLTNTLSPLRALGGTVGIMLAYSAVVFAAFVWDGRVLDMMTVPLTLVVGYGATVIENFLRQQQQRAMLMQLFSKHVSPEIADTIWQQREDFLAGGRLRSQKTTATVFFSDLKNFTTISEKMDTQALMDWINDYMEIMAQLIMKHGGVVDDYYGDAIKANFGVPFSRTTSEKVAEDAAKAVECALAMGAELRRLNEMWRMQGLPPVGMRIGVYTGEVVAGCIGSSQRLKFTTIGDTVNTASRLESFEKDMDQDDLQTNPCRILIGESTALLLGEKFLMEPVGALTLKGKQKRLMVYRVQGAVHDKPSSS